MGSIVQVRARESDSPRLAGVLRDKAILFGVTTGPVADLTASPGTNKHFSCLVAVGTPDAGRRRRGSAGFAAPCFNRARSEADKRARWRRRRAIVKVNHLTVMAATSDAIDRHSGLSVAFI